MPTGYNVRDAGLKKTIALPAGALTVVTAGIDLETSLKGDFVAPGELVITIPALTTGELPDAQTITYTLEGDDNAAFTSAVTISTAVVQTGAGGAGAAATSLRMRLPTNCERFVRAKAIKVGAASAAAKSMTLELLS